MRETNRNEKNADVCDLEINIKVDFIIFSLFLTEFLKIFPSNLSKISESFRLVEVKEKKRFAFKYQFNRILMNHITMGQPGHVEMTSSIRRVAAVACLLIDFALADGSGNFIEFARILITDDVMSFELMSFVIAPRHETFNSCFYLCR